MKYMLWVVGLLALCIVDLSLAAGDAALGKTKSGECTECHGAKGEGTEGPKLAGKSEAELLQAMRDYKSGKREDANMKALMSKLSDQDMANLAAYYASLK